MELLRDPVLLIANPAARRGTRLHDVALAAFRAAAVRCDAVLTERAGHGAELATRLAADYGAVFALGGDGTAMEVVGALAHSATPVGILPAGTGNLVARALGIPLRVERAVPLLLAGDEVSVDLGMLHTGRRFAFSAGVGVDARMIHETPPRLKRTFGLGAYAAVAARASLSRRVFAVRVDVDGEVVERDAVAVMVANFGTVLSGLLTLGPGIKHDDGTLDLCVFSPESAGVAVHFVWRMFRRDFRAHPGVLYRPGRTFRVECTPPQLAQADGELIGMTPFSVRVEPHAARLLLPRRD
jgi:diacylglycerol kinase (ATP)